MNQLVFKYFAMSLFRNSAAFEIRVVQVQAKSLEEAVKKATTSMERYAKEFVCEYSGVVNVFEAGSDMIEEYGEVFSLTCRSDHVFESMFESKLKSSLGVRSITSL